MEKALHDINPMARVATVRRPMLGLTILLIEDSRFASEAVRLLCIRCGARLRRADSLRAARRHLTGYRPSVVIVDLGLPDGSGLDIIQEISAIRPRAPVILATSGEDPLLCGPVAIAAGADGFMAKPLKNLRSFQENIMRHIPTAPKANLRNVVAMQPDVTLDQLALREDLDHISKLIRTAVKDGDQGVLTYAAQFLRSVADTARDQDLLDAAFELSARLSAGFQGRQQAAKIAQLIDERVIMKSAV